MSNHPRLSQRAGLTRVQFYAFTRGLLCVCAFIPKAHEWGVHIPTKTQGKIPLGLPLPVVQKFALSTMLAISSREETIQLGLGRSQLRCCCWCWWSPLCQRLCLVTIQVGLCNLKKSQRSEKSRSVLASTGTTPFWMSLPSLRTPNRTCARTADTKAIC